VVSGGTPLENREGRQRGIPLLTNTAGIFETLESHQVGEQSTHHTGTNGPFQLRTICTNTRHTHTHIHTHTHAHTHTTHVHAHTRHEYTYALTRKTSLQSLVGTVAAASFTDDLQRWHKQLQTIEAVLGVWLDVQQLWVQMEEVSEATEWRLTPCM